MSAERNHSPKTGKTRQTLDQKIDSYIQRGYRVDELGKEGLYEYLVIGPTGRCFTRDQLMYGCPICEPFDEEAICIHDEKDLKEGDEAAELVKLIQKRNLRDIFPHGFRR